MPVRPKILRHTSSTPPAIVASKRERDKFYTGIAWRRCRAAFLDRNPLCADCEGLGILTEATIPHHVRERLERPDLAYDHSNLVGLCNRCHTKRHKGKHP